jgi:FkbM family methyltransferase
MKMMYDLINALNTLIFLTQNKSAYSLVFEQGDVWLKFHNGVFLALEKKINSISWFIFLQDQFEDCDWRFTRSLLKPDAVFFDIGANVGLYSLNVAQEIPGVKVHAFEPVRESYASLCRNVAKNNFGSKIICNQTAVGSSSGSVFMTSDFHASNYIVDSSSRYNTEAVTCVTLDEYVDRYRIEKIDFIKIDVECFEAEVLSGAMGTLAQHRPLVFMEITKANPREWNERRLSDYRKIVSAMENLGYTYCVIDDHDRVFHRERIHAASLTRFYHNYLFYYFNFKNWFTVLLKGKSLTAGGKVEPDLLEDTIQSIETKKLIVFGASNAYSQILRPVLNHCGIRPAYLVDNDPQKAGTAVEGIPLRPVSELKSEAGYGIYILVASMFYEEIKDQLGDMGFHEYQHFIQAI